MQPIEWRPVPEYEGYYEVSEHGQVRSIQRTVTTRRAVRVRLPSVTLRGSIDGSGYRRFVLNKDGRSKTHKAHRIVAFAFLGGPSSAELEVCHNDGDPLNNDWRNLRWDTRQANVHDRITHGRTYRGGAPRRIPKDGRAEIVRRREAGESFDALAKAYGVDYGTVRRVVAEDGGQHLLERLTCKNGHSWTDENVMFIRPGVRRCRICYRAAEMRKIAPKPCPHCGKAVAVIKRHVRAMHPEQISDTPG